jgi:hypothetical protein
MPGTLAPGVAQGVSPPFAGIRCREASSKNASSLVLGPAGAVFTGTAVPLCEEPGRSARVRHS